MPQDYKMPNGEVYSVPDNPSPELIQQIKSAVASLKADKGDWIDKAVYYGKQGGSALLRGLAALPALMAEAGNAERSTMGMGFEPGNALQDAGTIGLKPQSRAGKYAAAGIEGGVSGLMGGGASAPVRSLITGVGSGLGSEGAANVFGDTMLSRILGGLAGGGITSIGGAAKNTRQGLAQEALRDARPEDLIKAKALMQEAQAAGLPLNVSQAMPRASNLDQTVNTLAQSSHGVETARLLRNQPTDALMGVEREMAGLPGDVRQPQQVANNAQEVSSNLIEDLKAQRGAAWKDTYDKSLEAQQVPYELALSRAEDKLATAKAQLGKAQQLDANRRTGLLTVYQAKYERALAEHTAATKTYEQAVAEQAAAKQSYQAQLNQPTPIPAQGTPGERRGAVLADSARGGNAMDEVSGAQGRQAFLRGQGVIVGEDGQPLARAPEFPEIPKPQLQLPVAPDRTSPTNMMGEATPAAQVGVQAAQSGVDYAGAAFDRTTQLHPQVVLTAAKKLSDLAASVPNTSKEKLLIDIRNRLFDSEGNPITDAAKLNEILKDSAGRLKTVTLSTSGLDAGASKWVGRQIQALREDFGAAFVPYRQANRAYADFTENTLNPVKKSVVGDLAGVRGALADKQAAQTKLFHIFDQGTVPGGKGSDILTLEKSWRAVPNGPETFQDSVKSWMAKQISDAAQSSGGRASTSIPANLEKVFMGTDTKRQGFNDMLVGLARSQGLPDEALRPGMINMMRYIQAAARRPGNVAGTSAEQLSGASRSGIVEGVGHLNLFHPLREPARILNEYLNADAYQFMDKLVNSPEGVDTLIKLGRQPIMSKAASNTLATFAATLANSEGKGQD